jgi:hypothetical protein
LGNPLQGDSKWEYGAFDNLTLPGYMAVCLCLLNIWLLVKNFKESLVMEGGPSSVGDATSTSNGKEEALFLTRRASELRDNLGVVLLLFTLVGSGPRMFEPWPKLLWQSCLQFTFVCAACLGRESHMGGWLADPAIVPAVFSFVPSGERSNPAREPSLFPNPACVPRAFPAFACVCIVSDSTVSHCGLWSRHFH